ncbi:MAG: hypothetical protein QG662_422 [Pseudomonadota bacterium]|nr:hypothetical protein [Pseudomonadota bacterium]
MELYAGIDLHSNARRTGVENRGHENRGHENRGHENRGHENRGQVFHYHMT